MSSILSASTSEADDRGVGTRKLASRACRICYKRKIRCDRGLPKCFQCASNNRKCSFLNKAKSPPPDEDSLASGLPELTPAQRASAVQLVDPELFHQSQLSEAALSNTGFGLDEGGLSPTSPQVTRCILDSYFQMIDPWLPIIWKTRMYQRVLSPLTPGRQDSMFLLLCMDMLSGQPLSNRYHYYLRARKLLASLETAGYTSLMILQGYVLLALYEIGQAIYPAATITVGTCVTLGSALGLGLADQSANEGVGSVWMDREERLRLSWAISLLESFISLSNPKMSLMIPEPPLATHLPCRDTKWLSGQADDEHATLSAPPSSLDRFASVAQATYSLRQTLRHVSRKGSLGQGAHECEEEREQLDRTLCAQIEYHKRIVQGSSVACHQSALSYCALILLYKPYLVEDNSLADGRVDNPAKKRARWIMNDVSAHAVSVCERYFMEGHDAAAHGSIPPFTFHWLYMVGMWLIEHGDSHCLQVIKNLLKDLGPEWRVADLYHTLLEARQAASTR